ncbi:MAG: hypothetical protein ACRD5I_15200 [Candidatus Acidiferrales bacterium]
MKRVVFLGIVVSVCLVMIAGTQAGEKTKADLIAEAESAAPAVIAKHATIKTADGTVLRKGTNDWTCYPGTKVIGPMCNQPEWDALLAALGNSGPFKPTTLSVSYMLAGEGEALGVSNSDPFATDPKHSHDWVKEGPHLMIIVPDPAMLEGLSTDPKDPVYVMWKGTPYAHIMVKVAEEKP